VNAAIRAAAMRSLLTWLLVDSLAEPNARPASVLIDELDAGRFESTPDDIDGRAARLARTRPRDDGN
jgi:hypothetical protein